ncbi:MAG: nucleotide exchange factor GrpE [Rickettsiales bacterium]|jgi:molecular chaperone GrpE
MTASQDGIKNKDLQTDTDNGQEESEANVIDIKDAKIIALEEECAKLKENWIRAVAETDNVRKRSQRDLEESSKYAITGFASDMVSVLENLKRAVESIPTDALAESSVLKTLGEGVNLTLQELLGIFQKHGIVRIDPLGKKFDHNLHQAVTQIEKNDVEAGTIVQVIQSGYMIADRLLRPAMVAVSKTSAGDTKKLDTTA